MHRHEGLQWIVQFGLGLIAFVILMTAIWLLAHKWE